MFIIQCTLCFFVIWLNTSFSEEIIDSSCNLEQSGALGKCKLITKCKQIRDEVLLLHRLPKTCGFQGTQPIVCCPITKQPGDLSQQKCKEYAVYAHEKSSNGGAEYKCEHKIRKRVVGGVLVTRREFPHMAAIGFEDSQGKIKWKCGGSIISEQYILTVAHCGISSEAGAPKLVRVGVTNLNDNDHKQDLKVIQIIPHPDYKPPTQENDIALLKLEESIKMDSYARPACLYLNRQISVGKAIATGWGRTEFTGPISSDLLKVTLDIVDHDFCNMTYKRSIPKTLKNGIIDEIHVCAGSPSEQKDTCQGDAGGPLQIYHDGDDIMCMYDIVGITSFGKSCFGGPSVYTRVSNYIEWIENIVWEKSF